MHEIGRAFGKDHGSIRFQLSQHGGIAPAIHHRSQGTLTLAEREEAVVLQSNTAITRYNYTLTAHYDLLPRESTSPVKSGDVTALSAYNVAAAPFLYATVTEERDAKNRAANDVAERIRTELAVYLRKAADQAAR